jgi:hypothetical protein
VLTSVFDATSRVCQTTLVGMFCGNTMEEAHCQAAPWAADKAGGICAVQPVKYLYQHQGVVTGLGEVCRALQVR